MTVDKARDMGTIVEGRIWLCHGFGMVLQATVVAVPGESVEVEVVSALCPVGAVALSDALLLAAEHVGHGPGGPGPEH